MQTEMNGNFTTASSRLSLAKEEIDIDNPFGDVRAKNIWITKETEPFTEGALQRLSIYEKPPNVPQNLWEMLDVRDRELVLAEFTRTKKWSRPGSFYKFVFGDDAVDTAEVDTKVSTIAFVNAIVFTIPFQVAVTITPGILDSIEASLDACPGSTTYDGANFRYEFINIRNNLIVCAYCAMAVLIQSGVYFVFKPSFANIIGDKWCRTKIKVLLIMMLLESIASVVCLLSIFNFLIFFVVTQDVCSNFFVWFVPVVIFLIIFFVSSIYLIN